VIVAISRWRMQSGVGRDRIGAEHTPDLDEPQAQMYQYQP
jgi:hypothetical protein